MADGSSNLEILISAIDEASETFDEISESLSGMSEAASSASASTDESLESVGLTMNEVTGEISDAALSQQQSFALAAEVAQQSDQEIIDAMLEMGVTAQEAAATIAEADAAIAASSEDTAAAVGTSSTASKSSFIGIGAVAGVAFAAITSAVNSAISSSQEWDVESATIANTLADTGSAIPLSQIQDYAQQVQSVTLLTQQQALQAEGLIVNYKDLQPSYESLTMLTADLATKMSQTSGTMSDNMPQAARILTAALEDPAQGISQLVRQGTVALPAATVTMMESLASAGNTAGAQKILIDALNSSIGGMAQAAAQAPGAGLTQLQNQLTAFGTVIGNDLLPPLDAIAKAIAPIITEVSQWAQAHPQLTDAIIAGAVAFTGLVLVISIVGVAVLALGSTFAAVALIIAGLVAIIVGVVVDNWNIIKTDTDQVIDFLTTVFESFRTGVVIIWNDTWTTMLGIVENIWATIQNTVKTGIDYVITAINGFINALDAIHISIPSISIPGTKLATPSINLGFSIPDIPMLAEGGFVTQPTLAIIGEAGPEAVIPLSGMGAGGSGVGGQQINVYIQGGIFPADTSAIKQIGDLLAKTITQNIRVKNYQP